MNTVNLVLLKPTLRQARLSLFKRYSKLCQDMTGASRLHFGLMLVLLVGFASVTRAGAESGRATPTPAQPGGDASVEQELKRPVSAPVPDEWQTTFPDRLLFTRVRLADGSRMILRCDGDDRPISPPVLCRVGSDRPIDTGSMTFPRCLSTATLPKNGDVLIAGGVGTKPPSPCDTRICPGLTSAELYHTSRGTFEAVGNMLKVRLYHTATLLDNGKVLIAGGAFTARRPFGESGGGRTLRPGNAHVFQNREYAFRSLRTKG